MCFFYRSDQRSYSSLEKQEEAGEMRKSQGPGAFARSVTHKLFLSLTHTHLLQGLPGSCLQVVKFPLVLIRVARSVSSNQRRAIKETDNREIINSSVLRIKLKGKLAHNHYHHAADCRTSCTNLSQSQLYSHTLYLSL